MVDTVGIVPRRLSPAVEDPLRLGGLGNWLEVNPDKNFFLILYFESQSLRKNNNLWPKYCILALIYYYKMIYLLISEKMNISASLYPLYLLLKCVTF